MSLEDFKEYMSSVGHYQKYLSNKKPEDENILDIYAKKFV